jgi:type I restriction enzyme S subunit
MKTLSELCACVKDQCVPATSGASVYVGLEHIDSGTFFLNRQGKPCDVQSAKTRFRKGDVLYGKLRPYLDKGIIAPCDGICSTDILALRPNANTCAAYLLSLIHTADFRTHADQTTNGVNHPRTSWHGLAGFSWEVPSKLEQEKIAAVLWKIQRAIATEDKLVCIARELMRSAMHHLFTYGLHNEATKETDIGVIPQGWDVYPLGSLIDVTHGFAFKSEFFRDSGPVVLTPGNFKLDGGLYWGRNTKFTAEPYSDEFRFHAGDLVIVMTDLTPSAKLLGSPAFIPSDRIILHNQRIGNVVVTSDSVAKDFLYWLFLTQPFKNHMIRTATGSTVRHTSPGRIKSFLCPVPPAGEQKEIANILQTLDRKVSIHERKRGALSDLFRTLLNELMTAQIRVDQLDIDTSEVVALAANPT